MDFDKSALFAKAKSFGLNAAEKAAEVAKTAAERGKVAAENAKSIARAKSEDLRAALNDMTHRTELVHVQGHAIVLHKVLAEGGYGFVHLARGAEDGREYAVKRMLCQSREASEMAKAEIALMNQLKHPNVVALLASDHRPMNEGRGTEFLLVMVSHRPRRNAPTCICACASQ